MMIKLDRQNAAVVFPDQGCPPKVSLLLADNDKFKSRHQNRLDTDATILTYKSFQAWAGLQAHSPAANAMRDCTVVSGRGEVELELRPPSHGSMAKHTRDARLTSTELKTASSQ